MFNRAMVTLAEQAGSMPKPSQFDSRIRIGFAAGTPTHHRNFEIIVPALCEILSLYPETMLTIVGPLDIQKFENLLPFIPRIEQRPRVSLSELFGEYNCFDINLAPLLVGNQFDESKSELRYGIASLVSVPTVASPAIPMQETILDGDNGLLCDDIESWVSNLKLLVENPELRLKLGKSARRNVISGFGPGALKEKCHEIYSTIIEKGKVAG
jgi:glycosyltransferase involved in cell wall biosynthesis